MQQKHRVVIVIKSVYFYVFQEDGNNMVIQGTPESDLNQLNLSQIVRMAVVFDPESLAIFHRSNFKPGCC